jgi:MFS family permease
MLLNAFKTRIGTSLKTAFTSTILVASTLIWGLYSVYFLTVVAESGNLATSEVEIIQVVNLLSIVAAVVLGVFLVQRVRKRVVFLKYWIVGSVLLSLVPIAVNVTSFIPATIFFFFVGGYFGLGLPVSFGYFAASTETGNRSRLGGIVFLVSFLGVFLLGSLSMADVVLNALFLAVFEAITLGITVAIKPEEREILQSEFVGYRQILGNRSFLLYFIPWIMFTAIDFMALPLVNKIFPEYFIIIEMSGTLLAGVLAVAFGFFADYVGRKRLVVAGFALLGVGYGTLSIFQGNILGWCLFAIVDGFAWGIFCAVFLITIWGDLAHGKSGEKYYAIGFLPFLFSAVLPHTGTFISDMVQTSAPVFSFASVFLFIAVLPLAYAPETLNLKDLEFKSYLDKAIHRRLLVETEN